MMRTKLQNSWLPLSLRIGLIGLTGLLVAMALPNPVSTQQEESPRLVVLGFDGVDGALTEQWMDEGKLPNLARLRDEGTFSPLRSTIPSQTPVSWSTFATGLSPGRHGIFDFLRRDLETYRPSFAAFDLETKPFLWGEDTPPILGGIGGLALLLIGFLLLKLLRLRTGVAAATALVLGLLGAGGIYMASAKLLPKEQPNAINRRQGDTFWEILGQAGKRVKVVRVPVTFPPEPFEHGELLSGLGTPDLSFRIGKPFYFTSELFFSPPGGGVGLSIEIVELIDNQGEIPTQIKGPPNQLFPEQGGYITVPMTLAVSEDRSRLSLDIDGKTFELSPGDWSDWVEIDFPFNSLITMNGMGRFHLISLEPEVRLYLSPIQFDPKRLPPMLDITTPGEWVDELTDDFDRFKTIGWAIDTWSITDGTIDEAVFLEDTEFTVAKYEEMLLGLLGQDDWDTLVHYFEFTDRVQHVMYRHFDPEHALHTEEGAAKWGNSILEAYQRMDGIVGEVVETMPDDALLLIVSDHGFAPWRRTMNYNTWLAQNGYLVLEGEGPERANLEDLFDQGEFFVNVDWSKTRAYAMGLGNIYLNVAGREGQGIVQAGEEYDQLATEIKTKLEAFVDQVTGEHPVAHVFTRDEAYGTYDPNLIPDLFPSNSRGYRVGWQDSLGIVAKEVVEVNENVWSGDHCSVYPPLVNGILFSNLRLDASDPWMGDVMPTILDLYNVEPTVELDGESLLPAN